MPESQSPPTVFDFDVLAADYDSWYDTPDGRLYDILEKHALRRLIGVVPRGQRLLEMGAGSGWWSYFFSELGYRVTGVDVAPKMVAIAQSKRISEAHFGIADAHRLPFADGSFDAAAAITSLEFTRDPEQALRELVRCVTSTGKLFLGVLNREATINQLRQEQGQGPFGPARMFSAAELIQLLSPFGTITLRPCAFPQSTRLSAELATIADDTQAEIGRTNGAFLAVEVDRCTRKQN